jgi:glycosyltransferase involved in cell wall biosynthesis
MIQALRLERHHTLPHAPDVATLPLKSYAADSLSEAPGKFGHLRVAIVHDFFYTFCGAERVVEQLIHVFPHCDVFALFDFLPEGERGFLQGKQVNTSFIQRLPFARKRHRNYLPLMPLAIEQLDVSGYDLVVSSSYLAAKGVITGPDQLHVCYCHSPARYAWDLQHQYLSESKLGFGPKGMMARAILHYIRNWDVRSSVSVDRFIANSQFVAGRIKKLYRRRATVVNPPVDTDLFEVNTQPREDFYVVAGRMVPYKRTDLIVRAFAKMPGRRLIVIGDGPDMAKVKPLAGDNVTILGFRDNQVLRDYMRRAKALIFAAEEDFGIVPVESLSCGTPVIGYRKGGVTETVIDGQHGILFDRQTEESLIEAIEKFEAESECGAFPPKSLHQHSLRFSAQQFRTNIEALVARWAQAKWPQQELLVTSC